MEFPKDIWKCIMEECLSSNLRIVNKKMYQIYKEIKTERFKRLQQFQKELGNFVQIENFNLEKIEKFFNSDIKLPNKTLFNLQLELNGRTWSYDPNLDIIRKNYVSLLQLFIRYSNGYVLYNVGRSLMQFRDQLDFSKLPVFTKMTPDQFVIKNLDLLVTLFPQAIFHKPRDFPGKDALTSVEIRFDHDQVIFTTRLQVLRKTLETSIPELEKLVPPKIRRRKISIY